MSVETRMKEELQLSNKHNYSQYSNKSNQAPKKEKPAAPKSEAKVVERSEIAAKAMNERSEIAAKPIAPAEVKMEVAPVEPAKSVLVQEVVETTPLPETVSGVVVNCSKLNVRAEPSMFSDVVCVLDVETEIEINVVQSDNEWFKIYTAIGAEGYCMRKFVNARL